MSAAANLHENETTQEEALSHFQKVNLANQLRLMGDNQRSLDQAALRTKRFSEWEFTNVLGQPPKNGETGEEMRISIDSPVNETHNHYPPQQSAGTLAKTLLGAGLLASGIGVPLGGWMIANALLKPAVEKIVTTPGQDADVEATATITPAGE